MNLVATLALLVGCRAVAPDATQLDDGAEALGPVGALTRASLDLRGVRPTAREIAVAEAEGDDPEAWAARVDAFLHDARFGGRVRDLFAGIYLTRQDAYVGLEAADFGLDDPAAFAASVGEEPLRILAALAEEDLPYTDVVTADWTMADETLAAVLPVDYPAGATGWRRVRYTDERPSAGVLATNGMWWHYTTNISNLNRGRASAVSRMLLCQDYLSRTLEFDRDVDLLDPTSLADALHTNPGCVACHSTLDPLASYLFGFYPFVADSAVERATYHPERERFWRVTSGVAPAYHGTPGDTLDDLGHQIAADPRLTQCVTQQVAELLLGRETGVDDTAALLGHREALLAGGSTLRALFASVATDEAYRTGIGADGTFEAKMLSVEQLGTALEDLTGFRFTHDGYDLLGSDTYGVRTLAGGADGVYSTRPATVPTATSVLVQARVTQAAAWHVAAHDHANPGAARLFTGIDFTETPATDRPAMVAQLRALRLRLHGARVDADGPEVADDLALWTELHAIDRDSEAAWAGVLSVLLRDPAFLFY